MEEESLGLDWSSRQGEESCNRHTVWIDDQGCGFYTCRFHFKLIYAVTIRANRDFQAKRNISGKVNSAVETTQMPADCPGGEANLVQAIEKVILRGSVEHSDWVKM